ncbi:MAG: hypothetical protein ACYS8W_05470 [Planctomycetota bacterium]|jgi:hypothetical protein
MVSVTDPATSVNSEEFLQALLNAASTKHIRELLAQLPVVDPEDWKYNKENPETDWQEGKLHWYPVGGDRGNAGRIKLAGKPENPLAERTINAMESIIEQERLLELQRNPDAPMPSNPREAVLQYFDLPPLPEITKMKGKNIRDKRAYDYARTLARRVRVRLVRSPQPVEHAISIEDDGIGQKPEMIHKTLLALGSSDKPDKPYLIGVFGQGGSSAYAASGFSWIVSRRDERLRSEGEDGIGWTIVCHVFPKRRRDDYFAYLAAHPDGRVPSFPAAIADSVGYNRGTRFTHMKYNFGKMEPSRMLFPALNHLVFDPVLPYELYTSPSPEPPDPMFGNAYRLARKDKRVPKSIDKVFPPQSVTMGE